MSKEKRSGQGTTGGKQEAGRLFTRRDFMKAGSGFLACAVIPISCKGDEKRKVGSASEAVEAGAASWTGSENTADLIESVHLADIYHYGEFIDFGTAARFKYSLGGWMSGWGNDTSMNGVTYTWATDSPSRLYFTLNQPVALSISIRAKKGGTDQFSVYLNDKPLSRVSLQGDGFSDYALKSGIEATIAGENQLKLVFNTSERKIGGEPASFAVDYIRITPEGEDAAEGVQFSPPHLESLKQRYKCGDKELDTLMLPAPTMLSYYAEPAVGSKLCFSAATVSLGAGQTTPQASFKVRATPVDTGKPIDLFSKSVGEKGWSEEAIDLGPVAGKLCRLDLIAEKPPGATIALGAPGIRLASPKIEITGRKARNAIVILVDTLRADRLAAYSKTRVQTPVFNKFVEESTLFERCQAPSNWTKPSCATVLTGLYPDSHKARGHSSRLVTSIKMASEMFQGSGFATGAFIANGYLAAEFGFNRGWNEYVNFIRENKRTEAEHVYKKSLDFITANKDKPFFVYIQTIDPHVPYDPPADDLKLYDPQGYEGPVNPRSTGNLLEEFKRKRVELNARDRSRLEALYDGEVTYHDRYFGHFLDALKNLGVLDDTALIVCSDHGEEFFDHDSVGHGHTLYQELLHVPLVIRAPGLAPKGKRVKTEVGLADVLPTALAATGVPAPTSIEGHNLLPSCNGAAASPFSASFSSFFSEQDDRNLSWSVRKGSFKLYMRGPARSLLFNLDDDPREKADVDEKYPLAIRALRISMGQFIGAPDKANWMSKSIGAETVSSPAAPEEKADVPQDLKDQLKALGYMQ